MDLPHGIEPRAASGGLLEALSLLGFPAALRTESFGLLKSKCLIPSH